LKLEKKKRNLSEAFFAEGVTSANFLSSSERSEVRSFRKEDCAAFDSE